MTATTPKTLADLKYQDFSHTVTGTYSDVEAYAKKWFQGGDDLKIRHLFNEGDAKVYECYEDSGSIDYLYIEHYAS